jgi:predicted nucleic acid-binding protein
MKSLYQIESMVNQGRAVVFTSTVAIVEVLACHLTPEQAAKFKGLIGNPDTPFLSLDTKVAELAHEIRNYYSGKISTPDAIYLATAIHYEATAFHTYDGTSHRKRPGDLLRLPQPIAGKYKLPITIPEVPVEPPPPLLENAFHSPSAEEPLLPGIEDDSEHTRSETLGQQIKDGIAAITPAPETVDTRAKNQPKEEKG